MINNNFSVFDSKLRTGYKPVPGSTLMEPVYVDCLTIITETKSSRGFGYAVVSIDHAASKSVIVYAQSGVKFLTADVKEILSAICTPAGVKSYTVITDPNVIVSVPKTDLLIVNKLDELLMASNYNAYAFKLLKLTDRDTNNVSLNAYVNNIGTLMDTTGNPVVLTDAVIPVPPRKWCSHRKEVDWNLFWNSPLLTDEEKDMCRTSIDVQVAYSNKDRDTRKIIERQFYVDYPSRNWVFNLLHGVPGSGKTTMIMKDICALNNIPCLYIIGDARASISKMIAVVAPTQMPSGTVELTLTESVWAKCMKYNLPLVVFIDEIDTMNTLDLKQLGTLATEGKAVINTTHYKNNSKSIYYFGAFNPGSANASEFPDSFEDRLMWFSIPKVTEQEQIDYINISYMSKLNINNKQSLVQEYLDKLETYKQDDPALTEKIQNLALCFTSINLNACDEKALKWFLDEQLKTLVPQSSNVTFKEGVYTEAYAHQVNTIDYTPSVGMAIKKFFNRTNEKLAELTRGIQTTKRNRNSTITIPDRSYDVFVDLIFSYSSVDKAFEFMIKNRLPEGFVLNVPGANTQAGVDNAPNSIYTALHNYMEADIKDLQNFLFNTVVSPVADSYYTKYVKNLQHVAASTNVEEDDSLGLNEMVTDALRSSRSGGKTQAAKDKKSILDDLDSLDDIFNN